MDNTIETKIFGLNCYQIKSQGFINWNIVTYRNQLEVDPLKNIFFLDVLKLEEQNSNGYNKEIERMGKTLPTI